MSKKLIYLIRHGETEYNKLGIVQGSGVDSDLNETGQQQAFEFFKKYADIPFRKIYTSALKRTHQTVVHFLEKGIPHEQLPELNEISWGEKEGRIPNSKDDVLYADLLESWAKGETHRAAEGGESPEQVVERQKVGLEKILTNAEEDLILVAMHGRAMRILLSHITQSELSTMDQFAHTNTCLYLLEYSYETQSFEILVSNDSSHLEVKSNLIG